MEKKALKIIAGGSGGQGVLTLGKVLAYAGINRNLQVSCLPAYGAEMRGGYAYCTLVFSSGTDLPSPVISRADIGVFMNDRSFSMLSASLKTGGFSFINASLFKNSRDTGFKTFEIPATETAESLGNIQAANMVMAGALAYVVTKEFFTLDQRDVRSGIVNTIKDANARKLSEKAVETGWTLAEKLCQT